MTGCRWLDQAVEMIALRNAEPILVIGASDTGKCYLMTKNGKPNSDEVRQLLHLLLAQLQPGSASV